MNNNYIELIYANYLNVPALPSSVDRDLRQESALITLGTNTPYMNLYGSVEYSLKDEEWKRWIINSSFTPKGDCWVIATELFKNLDTDKIGGNVRVAFKFGK